MRTDRCFEALLPDEWGMEPFVMWRGGGWRMSIDNVPLALITAASTEMFFNGVPFTGDALEERALANLRRLQRALSGGRVEIMRVVGYRGVPLAPGQKIETPWGQLRPADAPHWLRPRSFSGFGLQDEATAVLIGTAEEQVFIDHAAQPMLPDGASTNARWQQEVVMQLVPLALVLGTAGRDPIRPTPLGETQILPWTTGIGWAMWVAPSGLRQRVGPLDEADLSRIERWSRLVAAHHHDQLAFAGRRIVSAVSARSSLEDVLVDSVIAWENLVGGAPETTFRTSGGMACLLAADPSARFELQDRLARIYRARSDVVHGRLGSDVGKWKWRIEEGAEKVGLEQVANEALDVAVRGLQAMIEQRPDLIPLGAAARAERLLMGG
jgi:hypothetical protein